MKLADSIGATEFQKQMLRNTIDGILQDKKMIVPYDNPENENCVSYRTIEDKVGIKLNIEAITLLSSFCNTYLYNKVEEKPHSIIIATHRKPESAYFMYEGEQRIDLSEKRAMEMIEKGEEIYKICKGKVTEYYGNGTQETMYDRFVDGKMIPSYEVSDEEIEEYSKRRKYMGLVENDTIVPDNIESYKDVINLMEGIKDTNYGYLFERLLHSKIIRNLPSQSGLSDKDKNDIEEFKKLEDISGGYINHKLYAEAFIMPGSFLKNHKDNPYSEDHEKGEARMSVMRESSKKVNGLRECIDEIVTNFNNGSIGNGEIINSSFLGKSQKNLKDRFERILVQGIYDGLLTDKDYFECMTVMQCMMELDKVKLSPEETLSYVIASVGGTPLNNTKTKEQRTL